jgi:hypothetical protein
LSRKGGRPQTGAALGTWSERSLGVNGRNRRAIIATWLCVALAGCSSASRPNETDAPARVAVKYVTTLFSSSPQEAGNLVLPASRSDFSAITGLIGHNVVSASGIKAGTTMVTGTTATVVFTGTICSATRVAAAANTEPNTCSSNADPNSDNPAFRVALRKASNGDWYVYFPS